MVGKTRVSAPRGSAGYWGFGHEMHQVFSFSLVTIVGSKSLCNTRILNFLFSLFWTPVFNTSATLSPTYASRFFLKYNFIFVFLPFMLTKKKGGKKKKIIKFLQNWEKKHFQCNLNCSSLLLSRHIREYITKVSHINLVSNTTQYSYS